ncbi:phage/plasmid primase, P4 family [Massilia sp. R2A-15]|uniref:phage/plasmid primase, P4 family n=1 Tax=Massilia sp. R2A-15 TaxID=3064278 RepID=UPI002735CFA9|nr:phage/plasmid primase, P4 family [Massilia sp. R2A-15]WLI89222.1 phage/plasmid primase, P4 family [Massilia sp. R2A-15]
MKKNEVIFCSTLQEAFAHFGFTYPSRMIAPGVMVRFPTNDNANDLAGWCKVFSDGKGAAFGCNRDGTKFVWQQRDSNTPPPTKAAQQGIRAKAAKARQLAEIERDKDYAIAAEGAISILSTSGEIDPAHPYVVRKGIKPFAAFQDRNNAILLPVYDRNGAVQSVQFISADGQKRFLRHAKLKGGRLVLGAPANGAPLTLAEGWATGCSIHEATGECVVVCFSGSNLDDVAADLRRHFPDSPLQVAGDLDTHGKGLEYAQAAAAAGAPANVQLPTFADGRDRGDFNDLHLHEGLDEVRRQLSAVFDGSDRAVVPFMEPLLPSCDARDGTRDSRPLTEFGNALRLFDTNGERLRYVYDARLWVSWYGGAWHWDDGSGLRTLAAHLPPSIYGEGTEYLTDAEHFAKWARKSQESRVINAAVALLSDFAQVRLPLSSLDADPNLVGFDEARQVVDLRNGSYRAATPFDYVTKSLAVTNIGDAALAVRWMQFLDQVFEGDQEFIDWLQRFCGYLLTGSTQEHLFLFCFGHGANGKSVFVELLKHVMGDYARAIASETLSESKRQAGSATPDLAALIGARLVMCSETEDNTALAESLVKSLVSGDSMAVRQLYAAPVQFTPGFKLIMCGNHKPVVRGNDNGIWRRVRLVPFTRTFSPAERDPHLLVTLKAEAPHILAWMLEGCIAWKKNALTDTPQAILHATAEYQNDQDLIGRWLEECTVSAPDSETTKADLYRNCKAWSVDNGLRPASEITLSRRLSERGLKERKSHGTRLWLGVRLVHSQHTTTEAYLRASEGF